MRGPRPRRKNHDESGSPCGPITWWRRKSTSLYLPSKQHGPRESVKMKKWREPLFARNAALRAARRCRHCCCMMAGPPANCRANSTTTLADALRQSAVTNGLCSIMRGMKPAAAYFVGQFLAPVSPHCRGWSHVCRQSDGSAHASSRKTRKLPVANHRRSAESCDGCETFSRSSSRGRGGGQPISSCSAGSLSAPLENPLATLQLACELLHQRLDPGHQGYLP